MRVETKISIHKIIYHYNAVTQLGNFRPREKNSNFGRLGWIRHEI